MFRFFFLNNSGGYGDFAVFIRYIAMTPMGGIRGWGVLGGWVFGHEFCDRLWPLEVLRPLSVYVSVGMCVFKCMCLKIMFYLFLLVPNHFYFLTVL